MISGWSGTASSVSWAVTRGPSLDPAEKRLAVEVEDHPLDYGDFEGTIPKGQYGGGTVMLWDRGFWEPEGDAEAMLAKGDLKFVLEGEKLHGGWVLVRMRNDRSAKYGKSKRNNWLLIKHHDKYAKDGDGEGDPGEGPFGGVGPGDEGRSRRAPARSPSLHAGEKLQGRCGLEQSQEKRSRRAQRKRAGAARKAEDKHVKSLPRFIEPQLCRLVERPPAGAGWVHEVKFDGYRMQLRVEDGKAALRTRKGLDWTEKFAAIAKAGAKLPDCHPRRRSLRAGSQRRAGFRRPCRRRCRTEKTEELIFFAFDLLFDGRRGSAPPAPDGRARRGWKNCSPHQKAASICAMSSISPAAATRCCESACRMKLEGIVSKRADAPYRIGPRRRLDQGQMPRRA